MSSEEIQPRSPTSPAHDVYEVMFLAADMYAAFWSPMLKSAGRWQLEMSQLGVRQARASMTLWQKLARTDNADRMTDAYRDYWYDVAGCYSEASRNIATALVRVAPHAAVLQLPLSRARQHDRLDLVDEKSHQARKVA